uniref:Putative Fic family protein. Filamentation induced by cAMP/death on curing, related n=1 Tax=Magnetococcus massalia (strain MO-1) TaxID=451514 RepID=A0A1S7LNH0_MAGMO|nr:Putative Fic family protein. Filamentation induced by cAMP/death on curing, related [Candidatus Magnetococcus massalia]
MRFESFQSGKRVQRFHYQSFEPTPVNQPWLWEDPTINALLEQANRALGELNAFSLIVPDVDLFIRLHITKEAQTSSKIEGTRTGMDEALMDEELILPEKRDDWREVTNYVQALNTALDRLEKLPLSNRLLRETHAILMQGVRGELKQPGEFRVSQNWIGGSSLADAVFIPPSHENVPDLMQDLEAFWHNESVTVPHLIRIAISHYQFETIHPFLDGNGRIGRLLIPLYLVDKGLLEKPSLYLSDFFEKNRSSYYDALTRVRENNDLIHWVRFFLQGVHTTATKGKTIFSQILALRNEVESTVFSMGKRAQRARDALDLLYKRPFVRTQDLEQELNISAPTANALLKALVEQNILVEITGQKRWRVYKFERYMDLFTGE